MFNAYVVVIAALRRNLGGESDSRRPAASEKYLLQ